ncbi:hypothetical protein SMICM304S_01922 [Streptomyces microflavus]
MDHTGRLRGRRALLDGPGAGFLRACREVGLEAQDVEADAAEGGEARLLLAHGLEELQGLVVVELDELGLDLGVEEDRLGGGDQGALLVLEVLVDQLVLVDVEHVEERLGMLSRCSSWRSLPFSVPAVMPAEKRVSPDSRIFCASSTAASTATFSFWRRDSS